MKKSEAAEIVMLLVGAYNRDVTEQTARVYETMLVDLDVAKCRAAVQRLIGTSRFLPTIAEIRSAAIEQQLGARRTGEDAYTELTAAVRAHGRDYGQGAPKFRDPLIARCIGVWGSWNDLCNSPSDDPGGRSRFIELYDQLSQAQRQDQVSGVPLPAPANDRPAFWLAPRKQVHPALEAPKTQDRATGLAEQRRVAGEGRYERMTKEQIDNAIAPGAARGSE